MYDRDAIQVPENLTSDLKDLPEKIRKEKTARSKYISTSKPSMLFKMPVLKPRPPSCARPCAALERSHQRHQQARNPRDPPHAPRISSNT